MDILVVRPDGSVRSEEFARYAREQGRHVHLGKPGQRMPHIECPWLGVVCFGPISSNDFKMLMEDMRYLSADLVVVSSETTPLFQHDQVHWRTLDTPDVELLQELAVHCRAERVPDSLRDLLIGPLITAVRQTLAEMVGVEVCVRAVYQRTSPTALGDLSAVLALPTPRDGLLILSFSAPAAETLGRRILAEVNTQPTPELIQDCVNEVGNVVAGQAKALLVATPYHFTFSPPTTDLTKTHLLSRNVTSVVIAFDTDIGNLALQVARL